MKIFKMEVYCMYCEVYIKSEPSYKPGKSHGCCDECFKREKSKIRQMVAKLRGQRK